MIVIPVKDGEVIDRALKRFKKTAIKPSSVEEYLGPIIYHSDI